MVGPKSLDNLWAKNWITKDQALPLNWYFWLLYKVSWMAIYINTCVCSWPWHPGQTTWNKIKLSIWALNFCLTEEMSSWNAIQAALRRNTRNQKAGGLVLKYLLHCIAFLAYFLCRWSKRSQRRYERSFKHVRQYSSNGYFILFPKWNNLIIWKLGF